MEQDLPERQRGAMTREANSERRTRLRPPQERLCDQRGDRVLALTNVEDGAAAGGFYWRKRYVSDANFRWHLIAAPDNGAVTAASRGRRLAVASAQHGGRIHQL
jgi:hypothetical protein